MSESEIRAYAQGRGFHDQTLARWLGWERTDRDALGELAVLCLRGFQERVAPWLFHKPFRSLQRCGRLFR